MTRRRLALAAAGLVVLLLAAGAWLASSPARLLSIAASIERGKADLEERRFSALGHDVVYLDGGEPDGPTVLLIHGFAADKDNWTRFAPALAKAGYRVVAPDLPGHGEPSRLDAFTYDIPNQVAFVEALRAHLGVEAVHVVGNSMGGHVAAGYAAAHPDRTRTLGLFNAAGVTSPTPSERARIVAETGDNPLLVTSAEDFDRLLAFLFVEPPKMPAAVKAHFANRAVTNRAFNDKIYGDLRDGRRLPLEPLLPSIATPTLVLWGDTDRVLDVSSVEVFTAGLPEAEAVILEACGHAPMVERPGEAGEVYLDFLARKAPAG